LDNLLSIYLLKNMVKVSAPGKLMLFGEHAVVYGKPCIVTAINHRMSVNIEKRGDENIVINAPEMDIENYSLSVEDLNKEHSKGVKFVITAIKNFFEKYGVKSGLDIETKSEFSSKFGFGSSSAVTVSTIKALSELFGIEMNNKELFDLSYKTILDIQGVGSGFDVAAAIYGGTIYFVGGGKEIKPLNIKNLPLIIGYTGIKADTATLVKGLAKKREKYKELVDAKFNLIEQIVLNTKEHFENNSWGELGELMDLNQGLLSSFGVSCLELENLIYAARNAGAYGAKLSGAGGGDCMIAFVSEEKREEVENAINQFGTIIKAEANAEGVRIED
jgi:mevalonate kinase